MTEKIIISIIAVLMLILTIRRNEKWSIILTSGLTIGVLFTWAGIPLLSIIGLLIYMISALSIVIYGIKKHELQRIEKIVISLMGIWAFIANLFELNHYPYANEIRLSMVIPLILYIILIGKGILKKKEFGFLTILNVDFLFRLLRYFN